MKILVAEPLAAAGIQILQSQPGWDVVVSNPKEYLQHLPDTDALLVRSAVKVTKEVLEKAPKLRVIGRAGVGVDNVDLAAATAAGVLVMNTPGGNAVSVAEHTLALMLAMARGVPQASASTKSGKWEKKKFLGNELRGKTLGVVGLGCIGQEVVKRARAFEMRIVASDPYVNPQIAKDLGVSLVELKTLYAESDYITLHVAATPETIRMLSAEAFAAMKTGVRIVNCARGELIDEAALKAALESGKASGAALDVFKPEPPAAGYPLFEIESVVATPHIAGSTEEAQEIVGVRIVEQMVEYLKSGIAINAVNMPALSPEQYRAIGPYVELAERLGGLVAQITQGNPRAVRLSYLGKLAENNTHLIRNAGLAGILNRWLSSRANLVNAMQLATQRGLDVSEHHEKRAGHMDTIRLELETDLGKITVEGAVVLDKPRLIQVNGIYCEVPLTGHLVFMVNSDVPGVIGHVGTVLGRNEINIANFSLGRRETAPPTGEPREALAVVEVDSLVPESVLAQLRDNPAVRVARSVALD
jgi:D-3-phosphoglycerate dehydrogenase / 2-oxoglutarate reductase